MIKVFFSSLAIVSFIMLTSCSGGGGANENQDTGPDGSGGTISIQLPQSLTSKKRDAGESQVTNYNLTVTGGNYSATKPGTPGMTVWFFNLSDGQYSLNIKAIFSDNSTKEANQDISFSSGKTAEVTVDQNIDGTISASVNYVENPDEPFTLDITQEHIFYLTYESDPDTKGDACFNNKGEYVNCNGDYQIKEIVESYALINNSKLYYDIYFYDYIDKNGAPIQKESLPEVLQNYYGLKIEKMYDITLINGTIIYTDADGNKSRLTNDYIEIQFLDKDNTYYIEGYNSGNPSNRDFSRVYE